MYLRVILLCLIPALLFADPVDSTTTKTKKDKKVSLTGIALPGRSPESGFYMQGGLIGLFNTDPKDTVTRSSNIYLFGMYSQYRQWRLSNGGDVFFPKEKYYINYWYYLSYLPDRYFGVGDKVRVDSSEFIYYNVTSFQTNIYRKVKPKFFAGLGQNFEIVTSPSSPDTGILKTQPVVGDRGYRVSGLGPKIKFDNRDNLFSSRRGMLLETGYMTYRHGIGSEYNFDIFYFDIRKFLSFRKKVWANQLYYSIAGGKVPFRYYRSVTARGYHPNLYRNFAVMSYQTEFRFPVWRWVWLTTWGGLSQSAASTAELSFSAIKYNVGGGIRLRCVEKYNMFMRIEYGVGKNTSSFYLSFYDEF